MCTLEKRGNLYILTLIGAGDEHRLNPTLIAAIRSSLSQIKSEISRSKSPPPTALITTAEGKFFSNGYDVKFADSSPSPLQTKIFMDAQLRALVSDLLSLPMPTVSAVTGHASAAGFILAIAHDYVLMRRERGFLYMSELDIGFVIPEWFVKMVNAKIGSSTAKRAVVMRAEKLTAEMAKEMGVVDAVGEGEKGTVEAAVKMAEELVKKGWNGEVYAENRKVFSKEVLEAIGAVDGVEVDGRIRLKAHL
uniref:Delta(3)-Delta(2)-enoyl-CoA isomerase n=3 Tax=Opuntia streptacantha TaxID=393608 RepID=A0A7C9DEC7_OPUST